MKISLLKQRENFDEIFKKSLSQFLENKYNWEGELGFSFTPNAKQFIVNDLLNVFYPVSISRDKLGSLTQEFSWHPNIFKTFIQKLYIFIAVRFPLEKYFSSSVFYITAHNSFLDDVVIIPGNHSIRLVDTNKNICTVICKAGFNKSLLVKDAQVRLDNSGLNVPKVIELNKQEGWYQEARVIGLPLNRLHNERDKVQFLIKCQNDLKQLYSKSLRQIQMSLFCKNILDDINELVEQIETSLEFEVKECLLGIVGFISKEISLCEDDDFNICNTHGDFQPANILCSDEGFWIIDWEYSNQRTIFYDALVFDLESRFTEHFSIRLKLLFDKLQNGEELFSWTGKTLNKKCIHYLHTFILEDVLLKLQELSGDAIQCKNDKLKPYLTEIQLFLSSINK